MVESGVTRIGNGAFSACSDATKVSMAEGVKEIGEYAFFGCSSIQSINIPGTVETIEGSAFGSCKSLISMTIPEGVVTLGGQVFSFCENLEEIWLPVSLKKIGYTFLYDVKKLKRIYYAGTEEQWEQIDISTNNDELNQAKILFSYRDSSNSKTASKTDKGWDVMFSSLWILCLLCSFANLMLMSCFARLLAKKGNNPRNLIINGLIVGVSFLIASFASSSMIDKTKYDDWIPVIRIIIIIFAFMFVIMTVIFSKKIKQIYN